jgi:hypothetical protein
MKIRILDIDWDLYDENSGETLTPKQAGVPEYVDIEVPDGEDVNTAAEEYMDRNFNWCYKSFSWEADPKGWGKKPRAKKKAAPKKKAGKRKPKVSAAKKADQKREKIIEEVLDKVRDACQYAMDNLMVRDSELEEIEWLLRQNLK